MEYDKWSLQETSLKNTQMFNIGYILAPVYIDFIRWTLSETKKPAFLLLRDGQPIFDIAMMLKNIPEFKRVGTWSTKVLTRSHFNNLKRYPVEMGKNYFMGEGLADNTHTLIDTGYAGSIQSNMQITYNIETESLFMFYEGESNTIKGYKNRHNYPAKDLEFDSSHIFEAIPKLSKSGAYIMFEWNGSFKWEPIPETSPGEQQFYKNFLSGAESYIKGTQKLKDLQKNSDAANEILGNKKLKKSLKLALETDIVYDSENQLVNEYKKPIDTDTLGEFVKDMRKQND